MMIKMLLIFICAIFLNSCGTSKDTPFVAPVEPETTTETVETKVIYRKISAEEAREIMNSTDDFILLDVRTEEEFREQRIDGAILIPDYEIAKRADLELPDKNAVILIYCRIGRRSAIAANELIGMGYTNIYDFGGIIDWDYETISD